jgi:glycosyltransferase involved in cell wall biosynthesis
VRAAIDARVSRPWEATVACTWGEAQIRATQGLAQFVVEAGVGYRHSWAKYRVFVSYAWMHFHYGQEGKHAGNSWYDVVIPNEIDPALFDFRPQDKTGELLFMGRLNDDKGVALAIDVARRVGLMFEEYYQMLLDLAGDGWYAARPNRQQLDWLTKRFPAGRS